MFNIGMGEALLLVGLALLIFGPERLPKVMSQAGRTLRQFRTLAQDAQQDLRDGLGPEYANFDVADLNPRQFVRKHLLEGDDGEVTMRRPSGARDESPASSRVPASGERPPFDHDAT